MSPATAANMLESHALTTAKIASEDVTAGELGLDAPEIPPSGPPREKLMTTPKLPAEAPIYYSPKEPASGILTESHGEIVHFGHGRLQTEDPKLIEALEKGVREGRYYKADLPMTLVCGKCGLPWKNQKAYEIHVQSHNVE